MQVTYFLIFLLINWCKCEDYFLGHARPKLESIKSIFKNGTENENFEKSSQKCLKDLFTYIEDFDEGKSWAVYMNNAGAGYRKSTELLQGTWYQGQLSDYGIGFEKCLNLEEVEITGSFCVITLNIEKFLEKQPEHVRNSDYVKNFMKLYDGGTMNSTHKYFQFSAPIRLRLGACLPDSCSPEILNKLDLLPENTEVAHCQTKKGNDEYMALNASDWSFIIFLGILVIIIAAGTYRDLYHPQTDVQKQNGALHEVLKAFSLVQNGKELFENSNKKDTISSFDGIRSLSISLEVIFHSLYTVQFIPYVNFNQYWSIFYDPIKVMFQSLHVVVDTYYLMGGWLMTYNFLKKHNSTGGVHFSSIRHYLQRYLRITPVVAFTLWLHITVFRLVNIVFEKPGPLWHEDPKGDGLLYHFVGDCRRSSWAILLHIQNLVAPLNLCLEQLWYICTDFQAYLISPILLLFMANKAYGKTTKFWILTLIATVATLISFGVVWSYGWSAFQLNNATSEDYHSVYYMNPFTKLYTWFVGIVFGFLYFHASTNYSLNKWLSSPRNQKILWSLSGVTILFVSHGLLFFDQESRILEGWSAVGHAFYMTAYRLFWTIMVGINVYTFQVIIPNGRGNKFFSNYLFQILAKLSYSIYVIHMSICYLKQQYPHGSSLLNAMSTITEAAGLYPMHIIGALLLYFGVEMPFSKLTKFILPPEKIPKMQEEIKNGVPQSTNKKLE